MMKIAALTASFGSADGARDRSWPMRLQDSIQAQDGSTIVVAQGRDGWGPYSAQEVPIDKAGNTMLMRTIAQAPNVVLVSSDLIFNSTVTGTDHGVIEPLAVQLADATNLHLQIADTMPKAQQIYVSMTPPQTFTFAGIAYNVASTNYAQVDSAMRALYGENVIVIDYALFVETLGTMDGLHGAFGIPQLIANDAFWGLFNLGIIGTQTPVINAGMYDGSSGSTAICAAIQAGTVQGQAYLASNNIKLPQGIAP